MGEVVQLSIVAKAKDQANCEEQFKILDQIAEFVSSGQVAGMGIALSLTDGSTTTWMNADHAPSLIGALEVLKQRLVRCYTGEA